MGNLLSCFDAASYSVATSGTLGHKDGHHQDEPRNIASRVTFSCRLNRMWLAAQEPLMTRRLIRLIDQEQPTAMVVVYPDLHFLHVGCQVARQTQIPWAAYLHDTIVESVSTPRCREKAARLQEQVFTEASSIFVMSEGMRDLYEHKYGYKSIPLEHTYPEPIPSAPREAPNRIQAFWGGAVYGINDHALIRILTALCSLDYPCIITSMSPALASADLSKSLIQHTFLPSRLDYLRILGEQSVLLLALNWPDECNVHMDEMSTIFPTKTIEYLASGRPILVHCPEHYFLARFFHTKRCGLVVTDRSAEALKAALQHLIEDGPQVRKMTQRALDVAQDFSLSHIAPVFRDHVESITEACWGVPAI